MEGGIYCPTTLRSGLLQLFGNSGVERSLGMKYLRTELRLAVAMEGRHVQLQGFLRPLTFLPRYPWGLAEIQSFIKPLTVLLCWAIGSQRSIEG